MARAPHGERDREHVPGGRSDGGLRAPRPAGRCSRVLLLVLLRRSEGPAGQRSRELSGGACDRHRRRCASEAPPRRGSRPPIQRDRPARFGWRIGQWEWDRKAERDPEEATWGAVFIIRQTVHYERHTICAQRLLTHAARVRWDRVVCLDLIDPAFIKKSRIFHFLELYSTVCTVYILNHS